MQTIGAPRTVHFFFRHLEYSSLHPVYIDREMRTFPDLYFCLYQCQYSNSRPRQVVIMCLGTPQQIWKYHRVLELQTKEILEYFRK